SNPVRSAWPALKRAVLAAALVCLVPPHELGGQPPVAGKGEAARCQSARGLLLARATPTAPWRPVRAGEAVPPGASLVSLFDSALHARGVEARLLGDVGERGPFPALETAVALHEPAKADLDVGLERGLLLLTNRKPKGAASVRLRLPGDQLELTLRQP